MAVTERRWDSTLGVLADLMARGAVIQDVQVAGHHDGQEHELEVVALLLVCLLYSSDAADEATIV